MKPTIIKQEPTGMLKMLDDKILELKNVPGDLYSFVLENCFMAGGAVRDTYRGVKPKDYDLFFKTKSALDEFVTKYQDYMVKTPAGNYDYMDFQFITMYYGSPEKVIGTFDWNCNQMYYDFKTKKNRAFNPDYLIFNVNANAPLSAAVRLPYLIEKGYKIRPKEMMFMMSFLAAKGILTSSKAAQENMAIAPSTGSQMDLSGAVDRAVDAALQDSPLMKSLKEGEEDAKIAPGWF
jgi:hypothetical protein